MVGELVLTNRGAAPALLLAGELFEGGWQHRALNHDVVLLRRAAAWSRASPAWSRAAGTAAPPGAAVPPGLDDGPLRPDHGHGWGPAGPGVGAGRSLRRGVRRVGHRVVRGPPGPARRPGRSPAAPTPMRGWPAASAVSGALGGQRGVLIGLGGQPAFLELFASTSGLRRHLAALLQAAAVDAALLPRSPLRGGGPAASSSAFPPHPCGSTPRSTRAAGRALASRSPYHEIRRAGVGPTSWCTPPSSTDATP